MPNAQSAGAIGDGLRQHAMKNNITRLECAGCTESAWVVEAREVARLVEHALFGHAGRQAIMSVQYTEQLSGYELGLRFGAPAQTEWEQKWREEQARVQATVDAG